MFGKKLVAYKHRLTAIDEEEPLNKLALAVIILLDLFVLGVLFAGLKDHTQQLTSLNEYMPRVARAVFIEQNWTPSVRLDKLQPLVLSDRKNYSYNYKSLFEEEKLERMHPLCRDFLGQIKALADNEKLVDLFLDRERNTKERANARSKQKKTKQAYDTRLLEAIAGQPSAATEAIAQQSRNLTARVERLTKQISEIGKTINARPDVQALWKMTDPENQNRQQVVDDFQRFERWYPVRELGWQLLFLLPIFGLFYFWSDRSVKKERRVQTLVTSHLLVVAFIPILLKISKLVIDLIPDQFFRALFTLLRSLHLIAIWHYIVIIGAVVLGLFLVFLIQKKVFNKERMRQKRLMKGACVRCGKKLPPNAAACPFCGREQFEKCPACEKPTPVGGVYCVQCGAPTK